MCVLIHFTHPYRLSFLSYAASEIFDKLFLPLEKKGVIAYNTGIGALAEWLRRGLQNLLHRFNSGRRLQMYDLLSHGRVAELVYAADLKSVDQKSCGFKSHLAHHNFDEILYMTTRLDKATMHKLVSLFVVVFGFTLVMLVVSELLGGAEKLRAAVEGAGVWAPLVYVLVKASTYIIAPLSGTSVEMASGALFGVWAGAGLSLLGSTLGGSVNYWIARTLGRAGVEKFAGKKALAKVDDTADRVGGWRTLLAARVVLSAIYDFISYAAGLARLPFWQFVAVSAIGGMPIVMLFPLLGHASVQSKAITYIIMGVAAVLFVTFVTVHLVHKRRQRSKL